ncbi:MAG: MFS transporter, partial [Candidatus Bipolaricaulota bacterium]
LVLWIGRRWDKQTAYTASITSWLLVMLSILFVPRGAKLLAITLAVLTGPGIAAAHALPRAMSADTLDVDQIQSGLRQEGIYAGIEVFARKISTKIVLAGIGPVLAWSGYVKNASTQSPQALLAIRLMLGLVPSLILMVAVALALKYPLNRKLHRQVQLQLSERGLLSKPLTDQKDNYKGGSE